MMENEIQNMIDSLAAALADAKKFDKGNAAAGTRLRKTLQDLKTTCGEARKKIQDIKNN